MKEDVLSFGPFSLVPSTRVLRRDGAVVPLGSRAFDMLVAMVRRSGTVVTPEELMAIAWPGVIVVESNVRVQVANLRRTLGCGRDGARYITNVAGRGYCFVAPVRRVEAGDEAAPTDPKPEAARALASFPAPLEGGIGRDACVTEPAKLVRARYRGPDHPANRSATDGDARQCAHHRGARRPRALHLSASSRRRNHRRGCRTNDRA